MFHKLFTAAALCWLLPVGTLDAKPFAEMFPELAETADEQATTLLGGLDYVTGDVDISDGLAEIKLTDDYYFLGAKDAQYVLGELWGNPPNPAVLGMIFPAQQTPLHDTWGLVVTYDDIGYVSDKDAANYDFDTLLKQMQADTVSENEWLRENGYSTVELIGWAEPPHYDQAERKLFWAKELAFEGSESNTLNYNIRVLGRRGVLVMNFIAGINQLDLVKAAAPEVMAMTEFGTGNRYADFDPSVDKVAAVGIGGLIAGKALAKTGLLALGLVFLKKAWIVLLLPLLWLKNLIFRKRD